VVNGFVVLLVSMRGGLVVLLALMQSLVVNGPVVLLVSMQSLVSSLVVQV
jgi:hypothetical protein